MVNFAEGPTKRCLLLFTKRLQKQVLERCKGGAATGRLGCCTLVKGTTAGSGIYDLIPETLKMKARIDELHQLCLKLVDFDEEKKTYFGCFNGGFVFFHEFPVVVNSKSRLREALSKKRIHLQPEWRTLCMNRSTGYTGINGWVYYPPPTTGINGWVHSSPRTTGIAATTGCSG